MFKNLLADNAGDAMNALTDVGFSTTQAAQFLPALAEQAGDVGALANPDLGQIMASLDIARIADKIGVSPTLVQQGLQAVIPVLRDKFDMGSAGGVLAAARSLF